MYYKGPTKACLWQLCVKLPYLVKTQACGFSATNDLLSYSWYFVALRLQQKSLRIAEEVHTEVYDTGAADAIGAAAAACG